LGQLTAKEDSYLAKSNALLPYLKALCEDMRLKVIHMLLKREMCVCEIMEELKLSQPAVSHHMKILKQAGLISDRKECIMDIKRKEQRCRSPETDTGTLPHNFIRGK
jgi:DNA-binding transcriptional ArsR family regulator